MPQATIEGMDKSIGSNGRSVTVEPMDQYNQRLVNNVHPSKWKNPEPAKKYNLVVIGAGTGGLISALGAAALGAKVALIEKHLMGGDCLNVGCVPSKGLIRAAKAFAQVRDGEEFGLSIPEGAKPNFSKIMERMRRLRSEISENDSAHRYKSLGIDVFIGHGTFLSSNSIIVGDKKLKFSKAIIATGARAATPRIPGLVEAGYLTNETIFSLTELPKRLGVIGSGPIGSEMAQSFARFGSQVTIFEKMGKILPREDMDAAEIVQKQFEKDNVNMIFNCDIEKVEKRGKERVVHLIHEGKKKEQVVDEILVGIGRAPNVEGLGLESIGVEFHPRNGVKVNDNLRTTNSNVYAVGDICFPYKFTHTAEALATIALTNALFTPSVPLLGIPLAPKKKASSLVIPWCTYTEPEVAHVGLYEEDAKKKGVPIDVFKHDLKHVDRAILDGENEGFVKIITKKGTDVILGATIVAAHAGEMISEITVAMNGKVGLKTIAGTIHPYPTQAESIKRAGGAYYKTKLTPFVKKLFTKWMAWKR